MTAVELTPILGTDTGLKSALSAEGLPTTDLEEEGRVFFRAIDNTGQTVGYSGIEWCGDDALLRSVVILPAFRSRAIGKRLTEETLRRLDGVRTVYLATMSATGFFAHIGFVPVDRSEVPAAVLATRQLSGLCPASATIMRRSSAEKPA